MINKLAKSGGRYTVLKKIIENKSLKILL